MPLLLALALGGVGATAACGGSESTGVGGAGGAGNGGASTSEGGSSSEGGSTPGTKPLKVMNWNTRNFLDDVNDPGSADDDFVKTAGEYQAQLTAVADVIAEHEPDVIVFAEVEDQGVLDDLDAELGGKYPERRIIDANDPRGIDIAAMSKVPLTDFVSHKDDVFSVEGTVAPEYKFARDCVEVKFTFEGQAFALLGVHLRSKGPPDDPDKRLAEAQRCRAIADDLAQQDPDLAIAILGDFNDLTDSPPFDAIAGSDPEFVDVATFVPEADRWTFDYMGTRELIDHQMVNPKMLSLLDQSSVLIPRGGSVGLASDHSPILATYLLP
jgi:endonuclease/exonuclease/phosphatase family metal-dependent hydrolase